MVSWFHVCRRAPGAGLSLLLLLIVSFSIPGIAKAESAATCSEPRLLEARDATVQVRGPGAEPVVELLLDGTFVTEGSFWPKPEHYAKLQSFSARFDRPHTATSVLLQTDADSAFDVRTSEDGQTWRTTRIEPHPTAVGMTTREVPLAASTLRMLEIRPAGRSGIMPVTEVQVLCNSAGLHSVLPEDEGTEDRRALPLSPIPSWRFPLILVVALLALAVKRLVTLEPIRALAPWVLGALAIASLESFLSARQGGPLVHEHEMFHYQLSSRYFDEVGYTGLYDCAVDAEANAGFADRVSLRTHRDLKTKNLVPSTQAIGSCKERFSEARFTEFSRDVGASARALGPGGYAMVLRDHGFNGSPAWLLLGQLADRTFGENFASHGRLGFVPYLDLAVLAASFVLVAWAFGFEALCVFVIAFCCNPLAAPTWTLGAYLRMPWVLCLTAALCFWKQRRETWGNAFALGAGLLRVFPLLVLLPRLAAGLLEKSRRAPALRGIALLGVVGAAVLGLSSWLVGAEVWSDFADNIRLHAGAISKNHVGLRTIFSYRPGSTAELLFEADAVDPFAKVKAARAANLQAVYPLYLFGRAAGLLLLLRGLFRFVRSGLPLQKTRLDLAFLGLACVGTFVDLSSYYFCFLGFFALDADRRGRGPVWTLAMLLVIALVAWGAGQDDTGFALMSFVVCAWSYAQLALIAPAIALEAPVAATKPKRLSAATRLGPLTVQQVVYVVGAGALGLALWHTVTRAWLSDDGFISFRYAQNLAQGKGLVFNAGEYMQGYSSLLLTLLVSLGVTASIDAPSVANAVGILSYLSLLGVLGTWSRGVLPRSGPWIPVAALLCALQDDFWDWGTGGLETSLYCLLSTAGILLILSGARKNRARLAAGGVVLGLACATRPDGVLFALVGVAVPFVIGFGRKPTAAVLRDTGIVLAPLVAIGSALAAVSLGYYGNLLPTTYYATSASVAHYAQGIAYVALYAAKHWAVTAALLLLPLFAPRLQRASEPLRNIVVYACSFGVYVTHVVHSGGDSMFARRLIPAMPFAFLLIEELLLAFPSRRRTALSGALALLSLFPLSPFGRQKALVLGVTDERGNSPTELVEFHMLVGKAASVAFQGLPLRAAIGEGMRAFGYASELPYLVEVNGLTHMDLAPAPLKSSAALMGPEKTANRGVLEKLGLHLIFHRGRPRASGPSLGEAYFGDVLVADILNYDRAIMDPLRANPNIRFEPIEKTLADATKGIPEMRCASARELLARLDPYYLEKHEAERQPLVALVNARCK